MRKLEAMFEIARRTNEACESECQVLFIHLHAQMLLLWQANDDDEMSEKEKERWPAVTLSYGDAGVAGEEGG